MEIIKDIEKYKNINEIEKNTLISLIGKYPCLDKKSSKILKILMENKADYYSLVCGLFLTDYRNNPEIVLELEIPDICKTLLSSVIKIENINIANNEISTENIKNLLISMANDIRVIIVKLADILIDAEETDKLDKKDAEKLHLLIKELYAPISARLGLSNLKSELQDLNLKFYHKKEYEKLERDLNTLRKNRDEEIENNIKKLQDMLKRIKIDGKVYGRVKHISSIFNKINDKHLQISQIYDLLAVRIIVNTESECYEVLSNINSLYQPIDGRFKDYIARPKANGYKSIHTTVIIENNDPLEIQIRTKAMHEFAEYGIAAHFLYKEKKSKTSSLDEKLIWVRKMLENTDFSTASDFLDELKTDLYANEIFVQSPLGKVVSLKENSTPIDFAYNIHTDVGNKCVGARVNGKMVPLTTKLENGDVVEIITNPNSHGPSRDWLKVVVTSCAKSKLNAFFKKEMKEDNIKKGKSIIENTCKAKHIDFKVLLKEDWLNELFEKYSLKSLDDVYASVGYGGLTSTQVVNKLLSKYKAEEKKEQEIILKESQSKKSGDTGISFDNDIKGLMVRYAKCCSPVAGDEIIGFISHGRGVTIHCKDCQNIKNLDQNRLINAYFTDVKNKLFNAHISILADKSSTIIMNATKIISEQKISITGINVVNTSANQGVIHIYVDVKNTEELNTLINKLSSLKEAIEVKREKGE